MHPIPYTYTYVHTVIGEAFQLLVGVTGGPSTRLTMIRQTTRLQYVVGMDPDDPKRMDKIREYAAIYGRFDCKRKAEKPLTLHEVCRSDVQHVHVSECILVARS